jgi:hypothetical protein
MSPSERSAPILESTSFMKHSIKLCLALALAIPLAACSENNAATTAMKDATAAAGSAVDSMKAEVSKMAEGSMVEVNKQIGDLQTKAAGLTGEKKTEAEGLIKNIVAKKDDIMKMLGDMKGMGAGAGLDGMKSKIMGAIPELKKMITDAMAKMK